MIKVIEREINLFLWGGLLMWRRPLLQGSSRPVETVNLNSDSGSTFVVHQICSFLMPWVLPLFYGWPFWCENMSFLTTEPSAHVNKLPAFCCSFLVVAYIMQVLWTDGLWFIIMWLGHIFASCFWNWGQMLACFSGIFMLCPIELAWENFRNFLKNYGLFWPSLTPILRIINAFLNWISSVSNPSIIHKH